MEWLSLRPGLVLRSDRTGLGEERRGTNFRAPSQTVRHGHRVQIPSGQVRGLSLSSRSCSRLGRLTWGLIGGSGGGCLCAWQATAQESAGVPVSS